MKVLGLNFGHDAGVSLVVDGAFERHWEKERHVRVRHAMGLTAADIESALAYLDCRLEDIDRVAITCTQGIPVMLFEGLKIRIRPSGWPLDGTPRVVLAGRDPRPYRQLTAARSPYAHTLAWSRQPPSEIVVFMEDALGLWPLPRRLGSLEAIAKHRLREKGLARRMLVGIELEIAGKTIPGAYVSHHLSHAYYCLADAHAERALIVTMDGATGSTFRGGGIFFGEGSTVHPVVAHAFWHGSFYQAVAGRFFGGMNSGKLMGLASWGNPIFATDELTGNWFDIPARFRERHEAVSERAPLRAHAARRWLEEAGLSGKPANLRDCERPPTFEADLAASAQRMFEQAMLKVVKVADRVARNSEFSYDAIILGGGCALNCPANSLLWTAFGGKLQIPPAINDEGISAGAALALSDLSNGPKARSGPRGPGKIAYKGRPYRASRTDFEPFLGQLEEVVVPSTPEALLAAQINQGAIVGLFEGAAEIGPRALGHRSLVASPLIAGNWSKVNLIKGRELWRPFAPIALPDEAEKYFEAFPTESYYMLFNARSKTDALPAVTHVDGTARVQIAHPDNGFVYRLLETFRSETGCGVLMNTSFNGRGEPIVETPEHALRAFLRLKLDFLYLDGIVLRPKAATD